ncbi:MAG TPA: hypothetical protein VGK73_02370 [Polyangiaceae bacterium]
MKRVLFGWVVLSLGTGCGGGGGLGKPVAEFPSKAELRDMIATRAEPVESLKTASVSSWKLEAKVPAPGAAYPAETPWDRVFARAVSETGGGALSAELRCAAEETARFYVTNGGFPDDATRRYFVERCGSTLVSIRLGTLTGDVPDSVPDAEIIKQYEESVRKTVDAAGLDAQTHVGFGVARAKGKVGVVLYSGRPVARFSNFSPLVSGDSVTLEGQVSPGAAYALALVNQGPNGVLACEPDRTLSLPRFRVTCPIAADDQQARIEIATRNPGRVLMEIELAALVRRNDEAGLVYEPVTPDAETVASDGNAFQAALLGQLNDARKVAGRGPFALAAEQSSVNQKLAPHMLRAASEGNEDIIDRIGLGVLAGWDVEGVIRDGGIYWGTVTSGASPGRWLSYALESPMGRFILLDPDMTKVAIGAEKVNPGAIALVTTYSFFQSRDHRADEDAVFKELVKRRAARKHGAPQRMPRARALESALAQIASNATTTEDALTDVMQSVSTSEHIPVSGWIMETTDLKQITWPDVLLDQDPISVEVGVTHYRAPGGAWGQYAVLFVIREAGGERHTAKAGTPARSGGKL